MLIPFPAHTIANLRMDRFCNAWFGWYTIGIFIFHTAWLPIVECLVKDILQDLFEDNVYEVILHRKQVLI